MTVKASEQLRGLKNWQPPAMIEDMPYGDMPGDKVVLSELLVPNATKLFKTLCEELPGYMEKNEANRVVVSLSGGSGVGKSSIATLLTYYFNEIGVGCYNLSGDNYPRRIPQYNDAERLQLFREKGIRHMVEQGVYTKERYEVIQQLQVVGDDANPIHINTYPWFETYLEGGKEALRGYLGTPQELRFEELDAILKQFKKGQEILWLKRMGRTDTELWYDAVDFKDIHILLLEWTHGNSDDLAEVDFPILLNSTPEETLAYRKARNRDAAVDSPFTACVLEIEQALLHSQAKKAKLILSKDGDFLTYEQYREAMNK